MPVTQQSLQALATTRPIETNQKVAPAISLAQARDWLRITDDSENNLLTALISAATRRTEDSTRRALIDTTYIDHFRSFAQVHELARADAHTLLTIQYFDTSGILQTLSPEYTFTFTPIDQGIGQLRFHSTNTPTPSFPDLDENRLLPVQITYTAGYGTAPENIPDTLLTAVRYLLAHYYENRTPINIGSSVNPIPETVETLLQMHRVYRGN